MEVVINGGHIVTIVGMLLITLTAIVYMKD